MFSIKDLSTLSHSAGNYSQPSAAGEMTFPPLNNPITTDCSGLHVVIRLRVVLRLPLLVT